MASSSLLSEIQKSEHYSLKYSFSSSWDTAKAAQEFLGVQEKDLRKELRVCRITEEQAGKERDEKKPKNHHLSRKAAARGRMLQDVWSRGVCAMPRRFMWADLK